MNKTKLTTNKISIEEQTTPHYVGNFYYNISMDSIYILCQVDDSLVCLIGLDSANRYSEPVLVEDIDTLTDSEFHDVCTGQTKNFKLLSSVNITASI